MFFAPTAFALTWVAPGHYRAVMWLEQEGVVKAGILAVPLACFPVVL